MPASYLPWTQGQPYLLPPSPDDWLPQGHLARFVVDLVDQLDLTDIYARIEAGRAPQGRPAYPPRLMVALLLYAYMTGTPSSRAIQRKCHEDIGYRFLCGNLQPDFRTIARFRKEHLACLPDLFVQSVTLCVAAGLVDMDLVAVDGTRMLANASKRKAMSYGRMKKEEGKLRRRIEELLQQAEATDAAEDEAMGDDDGMPQVREELRDARARRAFIAEQMRVLEAESRSDRAAELREFAEGNERRATELEATGDSRGEARRKRTNARKQREKADDLDDDPPPPAAPTDLPSSRHATTPGGAPKSRVQRNFTDPDSRIMKHDGAFIQAYNAQAAVDDKRQVIVAQGVSSVAADTFTSSRWCGG
jgi:transposase